MRLANDWYSGWVCKSVKLFYPGVAARFAECGDWHEKEYGFRPLFGLFFCLCINAMFHGQARIHCHPHVDFKNVVGVCALVIYLIPGKWMAKWQVGSVEQALRKTL